jgi:Arf-GAP/SH3 domain/ANK repeat/PH domain-containing protein
MGQVTSAPDKSGIWSSGHYPIYVTEILAPQSFEIKSSDGLKKCLKVDQQTKAISLPTSPLSNFTQNETNDGYPFILNIRQEDVIRLNFKLIQSVYRRSFHDDGNPIELLENIKAQIYDNEGELLTEFSLFKKIQLVKNQKTTVDPDDFQVLLDNEDAVDFSFIIDLDKISTYGKITIVVRGNNENIVRFSVFISQPDATTSTTERKASKGLEVSPEMAESLNTITLLKDGPVFQNEMKRLESDISNLKPILKNIIRKAQTLDETLRNLAISQSSLSSSLSDLINYSVKIDNQIVQNLICETTLLLTERSTQNIEHANNLTQYLINPLITLYNSDLKLTKAKRTLFRDNASEFYNVTEVGPGAGFEKTQEFHLSRLDYFIYLNEFKKGYQIRNLAYNIALFFKKSSPRDCDALRDALQFYESYQEYKLNHDLLRESLMSCGTLEELNEVLSQTGNHDTSRSEPSTDVPQPVEKEYSVQKSDILYSFDSETISWRRRYVELKDNLLQVFHLTDDRAKASLSDQINLTGATINKFKTKNKLKCCFEIITRSGTSKSFQVYSEIEQRSWVKLLNSAAELSTFDLKDQPRKVSKEANSSPSKVENAHLLAVLSSDSLIINSNSSPLQIVQEVDTSNRICCDCGSTIAVEWISLNLLVVLCAECSNAHSSLGPHVSKITSLSNNMKLFKEKEVRELLYHVSNQVSNSYWVGRLNDQEKLATGCSSQERLEFITKKYINKAFQRTESKFKSNESLIRGVKSKNVSLILKALSYDANPSVKVFKDLAGQRIELSIFEYSLRNCAIASADKQPVFHISQLLVYNDTSVGDKVHNVLPLDEYQKNFWLLKINEKKNPPNSNTNSASVSKSNNRFSMKKSFSLRSIHNDDQDRNKRNSKLLFFKKK